MKCEDWPCCGHGTIYVMKVDIYRDGKKVGYASIHFPYHEIEIHDLTEELPGLYELVPVKEEES
jgi:hypothetical protein